MGLRQQEDEDAVQFANRVKAAIARQGGLVDLLWWVNTSLWNKTKTHAAKNTVCLKKSWTMEYLYSLYSLLYKKCTHLSNTLFISALYLYFVFDFPKYQSLFFFHFIIIALLCVCFQGRWLKAQ